MSLFVVFPANPRLKRNIHHGIDHMNLAICTAGELFGGVERHVVGMGTWLLRQGTTPLVILFHDRELAKQLRDVGIEPVILTPRGAWDLSVVGGLGRLLADRNIDVVHAHGYRAVVNCALARRSHRFAMVRTVHGLVESARWWTVGGFKSHLYTRLERHFGRRAGAAVVYVTEDLRQRHAQYDKGLVTKTIHNGIDPLDRADYSRPADLERGRFHLAAVGRVTRVKGLEFAIRAVAGLESESKVVLNIIGTGPLTPELKELAAELDVQGRVRFLGFKKNVYDYMAHCDALIMPSLHEGAPYTVLEAMSLELRVLASRTGGLPALLAEGEVGLLVEVGDEVQWKKAIMESMGERDLGVDGGMAGRQYQLDNFSLDTMGLAYNDMYYEASVS